MQAGPNRLSRPAARYFRRKCLRLVPACSQICPLFVNPDSKRSRGTAFGGRTLTDAQWCRIAEHRPGGPGLPGRNRVDARLVVDAFSGMAGNAAHRRDRPELFGKQTALHAGFRRRSHADMWERLHHALAGMPDFEECRSTAKFQKMHAAASGAKGGRSQPHRSFTLRVDDKTTCCRLCLRFANRIHANYGDCPQANAACEAAPRRACITDTLRANAQIRAEPGRAIPPQIGRKPYKDRPQP
ncbi:transposase [Pseudogemmobacter bohemicus]|uniref:transposase n=1 Tax=Pseudogemmobacter bohemicus TaxID=2250708 RepID=UPI0038CD4AC6